MARHTLAAAITLAVACTAALAACGSSNRTTAGAAGPSHAALAAARCMRAHGVPRFPDPGPHGGMTVNLSPGDSTVTIDGSPFSGPAFQAAEKLCRPLGDGGPANPAVSDEQRRTMIAFARCMRRHGFPQWADPVFPPGGGIMGGGGPSTRNVPGVKRAAAICNKASA